MHIYKGNTPGRVPLISYNIKLNIPICFRYQAALLSAQGCCSPAGAVSHSGQPGTTCQRKETFLPNVFNLIFSISINIVKCTECTNIFSQIFFPSCLAQEIDNFKVTYWHTCLTLTCDSRLTSRVTCPATSSLLTGPGVVTRYDKILWSYDLMIILSSYHLIILSSYDLMILWSYDLMI